MIFYLGNSDIDFYFTNNSFSEIKKTDNSQLSDFHVDIFDIYDIELENDCNEKPNEFNLHTITKTYSHMIYMKLIFYFEEGNIYPSCPSGQSTVIYSETQSQAFFDEYNDTRIFFYSYTDISQFFCGNAILNHGLLDKEYANPFNIINEEIRSEYEIKNINIIQGTKYAYYTIKNNISDIYYYGIVDLLQMKILYNIEKEMTSFIPYSKSEMLAITQNSVYKICIIKKDNICLESCDLDEFITNTEGNKCYHHCENNEIKFIPDNTCIEKNNCDTNIYVLNQEETECGLCSYFYPGGSKYKLQFIIN